jgi:predicted 2-oxoglutarate/Fe(II)-dependent dioxygenase YbiX
MEMYGMRDAFVMKYSMDTQRKLNLHNDASLVTGSVKLNDNFEGGDLLFPRQGISNKDIPPGKMILFPGMVTHGHECTELTKGTKYSLTMWSSRYPGDIL